jgi:hypothetical protein
VTPFLPQSPAIEAGVGGSQVLLPFELLLIASGINITANDEAQARRYARTDGAEFASQWSYELADVRPAPPGSQPIPIERAEFITKSAVPIAGTRMFDCAIATLVRVPARSMEEAVEQLSQVLHIEPSAVQADNRPSPRP